MKCARCDWQPDREGDISENEIRGDVTPPREQLRAHALDAGHPLCTCCGRSLSQHDPALACETCLTAAREHLSGIETMYDELRGHLGVLTGASGSPGSSEEFTLQGGPVLALLGPGSNGTAPDARGDRAHGIDNDPTDPTSVAWALETWVQDWYQARGWLDDMPAPKVSRLAGYLEVHARWAANQHDAFSEFAEDMRVLHVRLEQATGRYRAPMKAGASCFDCGGDLVRRVNDEGLEEDRVTCTRCREQYDQARYLLALAARRQQGLDGWVPYRAAATAARRPVPTLWSWVQRLQVTAVCRVADRATLVWYPDVDARAASKGRISA